MSGEELITSSVLVKIISADKIRLTSPPNPEKRGHATADPKKRDKQDKFGGDAVSHVFC